MDDEKRTVLVAALSAYIELLAKNTKQLDLEQGKGKGKASDDDVDLKAEIQNQIKICSELSGRITDATSGRGIARTFEVVRPEPWNEPENVPEKSPAENKGETGNSWGDSLSQNFCAPTAASSEATTLSSSQPHRSYIVEEEPYLNHFTGLPVVTETGFEAGPSNRSPPPLQSPPRPPSLSSRSLPIRSGLSSEPPVQPAPKPLHLRARPTTLPQPTLTRSVTLSPQRPALPPPLSPQSMLTRSATLPPQRLAQPLPPLPALEPQKLQQTLTSSAPPPEYSLTHMSNGVEEGVATEQHTNIFPSHKFVNISSLPNAQPPMSSSPFESSETEIQDIGERASRYVDQVPSPTHKNRYLRYITELTSKALKATGSMISTTRTPSVYQTRSLSTGYMENRLGELPAELPGYAFNSKPGLVIQRRQSQESLPPAYDTLSDISRRPSLTPNSSAAGSRMWTLPSTFSSRTSLSPDPPGTGSSKGPQRDSTQASTEASYTSSSSRLRKSTSRISTPPIATSLQTSTPSSSLPHITPGVKASSNWTHSATTHSTRTTNPYSIAGSASPVTKTQEGHFNRRQTISTASSWRVESGNFADGRVSADDMIASGLALDDSHSKAWKQQSITLPKSPSITHGHARRVNYVQKQPLSPPGPNNPWSDQLAADQAYARSLQLEEEQELQMERDMLLAHRLANKTADDGDLELAYFTHQESARLINSTNAEQGNLAQASFDLWGMDSDALEVQKDWLEARELDKQLRAQSSADEASFLEAKRLQEQYEQEAKNEEAWEEWKNSNVGECTSCLEEHAREVLVQECDHRYCNDCLQDGFKTALDSRAPFKCCKKALCIENCMGLSAAFLTEYEEMMLELSTPNPIFCCNVQCAKFLPPRVIVGDIGTCEKCSAKTCRHCRRRTHPGMFCAEDKETEAVKNLARTKGWKMCPGCNHLIERWVGCLHMICSRCQTAFCYRCSKPWKDCESTCPDPISATHPKR